MSQHVNDEAEDQYYVLHDNRETELMTLDELDSAFQEGRIHEDSLVCRVGDSTWLKLRDLANLDEEEAQEAAPAAPPVPARAAPVHAAPAQPAVYAPAPYAAPARAPSVAPYQTSVTPSRQFPSAPISRAPNSVAPLAFDLNDLDLDAAALRPKRRVGLIAGALGALVLGGAGIFALSGSAENVAAAVPVPTVAAAAALTPDALTTSAVQATSPSKPTPAAASTSDSSEDKPAASRGLTEDMKQALLAADKERESQRKSRAPAARRGGASGKSSKSGKSGKVFRSGGSAYDPLNGKL